MIICPINFVNIYTKLILLTKHFFMFYKRPVCDVPSVSYKAVNLNFFPEFNSNILNIKVKVFYFI